MNETCIKVADQWKYSFREVDKTRNTFDFPLSAMLDLAVARRHHGRVINLHCLPEKIIAGKTGAETADIRSVKKGDCFHIELRRLRYLNNIVEQDHWTMKSITGPTLV